MTELHPLQQLEGELKQQFDGQTDADLIRSMNAETNDVDVSLELSRRLGSIGLAWCWSKRNRVIIIDPSVQGAN